MTDLIAQFDRNLTGARPFLDLPGQSWTAGAARARLRRLTGGLRAQGCAPGARLMIRTRAEGDAIFLVLAAILSGMTPLVADAEATDAECAEIATITAADRIFSDRPLVGALDISEGLGGLEAEEADFAPRAAEVALMVLTSGTTSQPKAVQLTAANLVAQMQIWAEAYGFGPGIRLMNLLPLHHVDGLVRGPLAALWFAGSLDRAIGFSVSALPAILDRIVPAGITHFVTVPAMLRLVDRLGEDRPAAFRGPAFAEILCSADLLDPALWARVEARFGVTVRNAYGLSEVVCDALFSAPGEMATLGRPCGIEVRIMGPEGEAAEGELWLRGPTVMAGYFGAPEATAAVLQDGWFHTGDLVARGPKGDLLFVGRKKTAIVSAGLTIHPEAATQALATLPGLREAVAFGLPDPALGQRLVAVLVPDEAATLTEDQQAVRAASHLRGLLSPERAPRDYRIAPHLPRNAAGKVILSELAALWAAPQAETLAVDLASVAQVAARIFKVDPAVLDADSTPFNTEGWDSLAHMGLIDALEEAFDIRLSAMQIAQIACLGDALEFVAEAKRG